MTPAPQKEYIITDKMLKFFASQSFACEQVAAQARLYTSASSDVLKDLNEFDIINALKKRYWNEEAVLDSLENVEDEVLAATRQQTKCEGVRQNLEQVKAKPSKER